jgi:hypothetical protein
MLCTQHPAQAVLNCHHITAIGPHQGLALSGAGYAMSNTATPVFASHCSRDHHMGHSRLALDFTVEDVQPSCPKTCKLNPCLYCSCMTVSNDHVQHPSRLIRDLAEGLDLHAACLPRRHREGFWVGSWEELGRHMQQRAA